MNLVYSRSNQGIVSIDFPAFRAKSAAAGLFIFSAIWTTVCVAMLIFKVPLLFAGVFILFDILVLSILMGLVFVAVNIEVDANCRKLSVTKRFVGVSIKRREFDFNEIDFFEYEKGMQSGATSYYRIMANLVNGKSVNIGASLTSRSGAMRIAEELSKIVSGT
jgi:hypothetical protein